MMRSKTSQLSLMVDIAGKKKYPGGINILFLTEPPLVTKSNTIQGISDDIYSCFVEK